MIKDGVSNCLQVFYFSNMYVAWGLDFDFTFFCMKCT